MKFTGERRSRMLSVEITPMIDVVFLLIIFFMVTAQFARLTRAELELPQERGEQEETSEEAGLTINLTRDGELIVNDENVTMEDLERLVRAEIQKLPTRDPASVKLMVRADRSADTGTLNEVLRILERMGVGAARLATEVP